MRRVLQRLLVLVIVVASPSPTIAATPPSRQHIRAMSYGRSALRAFAEGDFARAAELYRAAAQIEPDVLQYVFGLARSEEEAGHRAAAIAALEDIDGRTPTGSPLAGKVKAALARLRNPPVHSVPTPLPPVPVPTPPAPALALPPVTTPTADVAPTMAIADSANATPAGGREKSLLVIEADLRPPPAPAASRVAGWSAAGVAAGALVTTVALSALAWSGQRHLDGNLMADGRYDLARISVAETWSQQRTINAEWTGAGVGSAVCVASGALALWLLLRVEAPAPHTPPFGSVEVLPAATSFSSARLAAPEMGAL